MLKKSIHYFQTEPKDSSRIKYIKDNFDVNDLDVYLNIVRLYTQNSSISEHSSETNELVDMPGLKM